MRAYLSVPIISNRSLERAQKIAEILERHGVDIISKWVLSKDPGWSLSPSEVFNRDVKGVEKCDLLVADVNEPSIGVGIEIALAWKMRKPIICLFEKGRRVSYMVLGMTNVVLLEYSNYDELEKLLEEALKNLGIKRSCNLTCKREIS